MKNFIAYLIFAIASFSCFKNLEAISSAALLTSTEADPDSFIDNCVSIITGDYCETANDLSVLGPDSIQLQRYHSSSNYITGQLEGGWRIFPQNYIVVGKGSQENFQKQPKEDDEWTYAFTGERSGGIFTYSGWRNSKGRSEHPLSINLLNNAEGMVNTYAKEISGQTNHANNLLHCKGRSCELYLGDGTVRFYKKVKSLPSQIFGEELVPFLAAQVESPEYYHLTQETLPSGNHILFSYNSEGRIAKIEMTNASQEKIISWLKFSYEFFENGCLIKISTSDQNNFVYRFTLYGLLNGACKYALTEIKGNQQAPTSYRYKIQNEKLLLVEKQFGGQYLELDYDLQGRVKTIKKPNANTGIPENTYTFEYHDGCTDVRDISGLKTRFLYDHRLQLIAIEKFDVQDQLYRCDKKVWGTGENIGLLLAKYGYDSSQAIKYYNSYIYDSHGNVLEKKIYGNLSGKQEVFLSIDADQHLLDSDTLEFSKTNFVYSQDRFNLLTEAGSISYYYKPRTNLCVKELTREKNKIKKRILRSYNEDGVCTQIAEDDGRNPNEKDISWVTERHIKKIYPKLNCPGVGLPETIEDMAYDPLTKQELLVKRLVNTFDPQGRLLCCATYDAEGKYTYSEEKAYNHYGMVISDINKHGHQNLYAYDDRGNLSSKVSSGDNKSVFYSYNFRNQVIQKTEAVADHTFITRNVFDDRGRKIQTEDSFGNATHYDYDEFGRLSKVIFPAVMDEEGNIIHPTFCYSYDIFGNVISETDACNHITNKVYNIYGKVTKIDYPDGSKELFLYRTNGNLQRKLSRDNIITSYEYDDQNRLLSQKKLQLQEGKEKVINAKTYTYSCFRCIEFKDIDLVTKYKFDPFGRPVHITTYPDKENAIASNTQTTEIIYDSLHRISKKKIWFDVGLDDYSIENYEYDLFGNILVKRIEDAAGNVLMQGGFAYDNFGHCIEEYGLEEGKKQQIIKTTYNSLGEPAAYEDALGHQTLVQMDYDYHNSIGQKVLKKTIQNPLGIKTEIEFDALSRVVKILKKDSLEQILSNQRIFYDAFGNKSSEIHDQIYEGQIIGNHITRWVHGPMGRIDEEIDAYGTDKVKTTKYIYNNLGQLISKKMPGFSNSLDFRYHEAGTLQSVTHIDDSLPKHQQVANIYEYNNHGIISRAMSEVNPGNVTRSFNSFEQMTSETVGMGDKNYTLNYTYDRKGRIKTIQLPDQSAIAYTYDGLFCRQVQRLSPQGEILYTHNYDVYDQRGRLLKETLIGKIGEKKYEHGLHGKIVKVNIPNLYNQENQYDALGRIVGVQCKGASTSNLSFTYNDLSQLTTEQNQVCDIYDYDSLDNRIKINDDKLIFGALNQLQGHGNTKYSYDAQGNLSDRKINQYNMHVDNNILSETKVFTKADKKKLYCLYDPLGRRLMKTYVEPNTNKIISRKRFIYLDGEEIGTIGEDGKIKHLRIPGIDGDKLSSKSIGIELNNKVYAPIHEIGGNVIALVDPETYSVVESYSYTAFGKESIYDGDGVKQIESPLKNPWRYAEKRIDDETGMVYFGRRYYDPKEGRWITPDPIGTADGPNCYAYLHNNPLNCHDHFGLNTENNTKPQEHWFYSNINQKPKQEVFWRMIGYEEVLCSADGRILSRQDLQEMWKSDALPQVTYNDSFEKPFNFYTSDEEYWTSIDLCDDIHSYYMPSKTYDLNKPEKKDFGIGFINGVNNSFDEALASANYISKLANGYNVHGVYNATHGFEADLCECAMGLNYIATEPVRQLHKMWNGFFNESSSDSKFLMICHSQGAIHVRNALLDYPEDLRKRIMVVAIAPGGYIYQQTCAEATHYRVESSRDLIPRIDQMGALRSKNTIIDLKSDAKAPFHDHNFTSPTYNKNLLGNIKDYLEI